MIDVDRVGLHAGDGESVLLRGEVLGVGRAMGKPNQRCGDVRTVPLEELSPGIKVGRSYGNQQDR